MPLQRSIRTLAWLGDAEFECHVRRRVAARGDFPIDRLDAVKARLVRADAQAQLLAEIEPTLLEDEGAIVRTARNSARARPKQSMRDYRAATALEALVAYWQARDDGEARFHVVLETALERAIDDAFIHVGERLRRG